MAGIRRLYPQPQPHPIYSLCVRSARDRRTRALAEDSQASQGRPAFAKAYLRSGKAKVDSHSLENEFRLPCTPPRV
jgi:hypothetical protein